MFGLHSENFVIFSHFLGNQTRQNVEVVFIFGEDHGKFNKWNLKNLDLMFIFAGSLVFSVALRLVPGKTEEIWNITLFIFLSGFGS